MDLPRQLRILISVGYVRGLTCRAPTSGSVSCVGNHWTLSLDRYACGAERCRPARSTPQIDTSFCDQRFTCGSTPLCHLLWHVGDLCTAASAGPRALPAPAARILASSTMNCGLSPYGTTKPPIGIALRITAFRHNRKAYPGVLYKKTPAPQILNFHYSVYTLLG